MKIIFKFEFIGEDTLNIKLLHICDSVLNFTDKYDGNYFFDSDIMIFSLGKFMFNERQIRLPQSSEVSYKMEYTHKFNNEEERYRTVKNYFISLNNWSLKSVSNKNVTNRIQMIKNYWSIM